MPSARITSSAPWVKLSTIGTMYNPSELSNVNPNSVNPMEPSPAGAEIVSVTLCLSSPRSNLNLDIVDA